MARERKEEYEYAKFFVQWLNKTYSLDYRVEKNPKENSHIDAFAVSETAKSEGLQVVTCEGEVIELAILNAKARKAGKDPIVRKGNFEKRILDAIARKDKKYPLDIKSNLILVIAGQMTSRDPELVVKTCRGYEQLPFRGIYYVSLPVVSCPATEYTRNGFVVAIKNAF